MFVFVTFETRDGEYEYGEEIWFEMEGEFGSPDEEKVRKKIIQYFDEVYQIEDEDISGDGLDINIDLGERTMKVDSVRYFNTKKQVADHLLFCKEIEL